MRLPFDSPDQLADGMWLLPRFVETHKLSETLHDITSASPPRQMRTPWGKTMSAYITNAGAVGWVSDHNGYRYSPHDPATGKPWPSIPHQFSKIAAKAAAQTGFDNFTPDVCLINRYCVGSQMRAHKDKDERDETQPIVSLSLGLPATFFFRLEKNGPSQKVQLHDGDIVVFGGPMRRCYHGIKPIAPGNHQVWGSTRWNLTFRKAL